jgi:hypothetical protein
MIGARCASVNIFGMETRPPPELAPKGDDGCFDFRVPMNACND